MQNLKKIYKSDKFPFLIYIMIFAIINILMKKSIDDIFFSSACTDINLIEYLSQRYQLWTSRVIIECILVIFCQYLPMFIWKIVNIGMLYLLAYSISELLVNTEKRKFNIIICIFLSTIPIDIFKEAGWMATMNNYLWVAATGIYSITIFKKIINKENINLWQKISYILTTIYASNQEQMAGILFIVYTIIGIVHIIKEKKCKPIIIINYTIIILQLILVLICPGNENRKIQEEAKWYPEFSDVSITTKMSESILSMMDYVVESGRVIFFALILLIAYAILKKQKNNIYKVIGTMPLLLVIILKYSMRILNEPAHIEIIQNSRIYVIAKLLAYISILILICIGLWIIFKDDKRKLLIINLIYFTGFISRFVMAFSPTIYASGERTSIFWYISFVMIIILIIQKLDSKKEIIENGKI